MSALKCRIFFFFFFWSAAVLGEIPQPGNLRINTVRWEHVLKWDPVSFPDGPVTYSVQRTFERKNNQSWTDAQNCTHITETECKLLDSLTFHSTYYLRVRAEHGSETSNWVEAKPLSPYKVPKPTNVTVDSFNMKHVIKWDPDVLQLGPVTYSVQFQGNFERTTYNESWSNAPNCTHITETECDLLDSLAFYATYYLRVRTEYESATSEWFETEPFSPYKDTVIGPPSVTVLSESGVIHVTISDPVREDGISLNDNYHDLAYRIFYWEKDSEENVKVHNKSVTTSTVLSDLKPWTTYCLEVQVWLKDNSKQGQLSPVICNSVTANAKRRALEATQVLFITLVAVMMVTLGCFFFVIYARKAIKYLMYPSYRLPLHIKEYLTEPSQQPIFATLDKDVLQEDHWDKLSIVSHSEITSVLLNSNKTDGSKSDKDTTKSDGKVLNEEDDLQSSQSSVDSGHYSNNTENSSQKNPQSLEDASKT
ncbi:interleukin-10 receptor subunit beta-like [Heptranchias perlo]|uniref:interleukin-10 receptor subunit beta-like n=1 Tax=Heptranchias perlo TaxID=212740 RepID=UPI00355A86DD